MRLVATVLDSTDLAHLETFLKHINYKVAGVTLGPEDAMLAEILSLPSKNTLILVT